MQSLDKPYTIEEILTLRSSNNYLTGVIQVDLGDIIDCNLEEFLDLISNKLINSTLLMDINYRVIDVKADNSLLIEVSGDVSEILKE